MRSPVIAAAAALPLLGAACGGDGSAQGTTPAADGSASIVGVWERETTCTELVRVLNEAGLGRRAAEFVAGNGFVPGVERVDQLDDPSSPCEHAVPRTHSHFFTPAGAFGSRDWNGEDVDDGTTASTERP